MVEKPSSADSTSVPASFRRLVARRTGSSFREVAEIEEISTPKLEQGQVTEHRSRHKAGQGIALTKRITFEYARRSLCR